jgi:hypothetical protein
LDARARPRSGEAYAQADHLGVTALRRSELAPCAGMRRRTCGVPGSSRRSAGTEGEDYYEVLGLGKEATTTDVKKAYRRLAMQVRARRTHPQADGQTDTHHACCSSTQIRTPVTRMRRGALGRHGTPVQKHARARTPIRCNAAQPGKPQPRARLKHGTTALQQRGTTLRCRSGSARRF